MTEIQELRTERRCYSSRRKEPDSRWSQKTWACLPSPGLRQKPSTVGHSWGSWQHNAHQNKTEEISHLQPAGPWNNFQMPPLHSIKLTMFRSSLFMTYAVIQLLQIETKDISSHSSISSLHSIVKILTFGALLGDAIAVGSTNTNNYKDTKILVFSQITKLL